MDYFFKWLNGYGEQIRKCWCVEFCNKELSNIYQEQNQLTINNQYDATSETKYLQPIISSKLPVFKAS